ncbi:glycosyltransferase [Phototrophicus methaneseepsis]|uniref:Glycosyltransferase n=1 Tax=Phototrophicus methaneseepsis TaxID=2710758 RepID=A0A7S8EBP2_9CHLR|nr:glycosyltransferase [Phototrophicus methaneseepsis]QPC83991.1 glycosyltransferase [Phototrophicus methaneseepsis]
MTLSSKQRRLKILISAYACRPNRGSEPGTGWHTVVELSKHHDLWVIACVEDQPDIEKYIAEHPMPSVTWIFYDFTGLLMSRRSNEIIRRVHYGLWQHLAYGTAKKLTEEVPFDVSLHITLGSYWRPSFLARLPIPFVWGPVGGAENAPMRWYRHLDMGTILWELPKVIMEESSRLLDPSVRNTARQATITLVPTERTYKRVKTLGAGDIRYVPQVRLPLSDIDMLKSLPPREDSDTVRFFSSGRLVGWKGIQFALRAFAKVAREVPNVEYYHVGDGGLIDEIRALAEELGVADRFVIFEGKSREENLEMMADSDVFMFPCLHDEPGWVVLEAMAIGRPIVFLKGMPRTPNAHKFGFGADSNSLDGAIEEMYQAMLKLAKDPALRKEMGQIAQQEMDEYLCFEKTTEELADILAEAAQPQSVAVPAPA